jgi:GTP-binding protein
LNKWDLVKLRRGEKQSVRQLIEETRSRIFFVDYASVLITSASTGENVTRLFALIEKVRNAARKRIGTGVLNRLLRQVFEGNPPPLVKGKRLKLFYAAQTRSGGLQSTDGSLERAPRFSKQRGDLAPPEFVLFVNDPRLITDAYRRYVEARIRKAEPYPGLPIILTLRPRAQKRSAPIRSSNTRRSNN